MLFLRGTDGAEKSGVCPSRTDRNTPLQCKVPPNLNVCLREAAFLDLDGPVNNGIAKGQKSQV